MRSADRLFIVRRGFTIVEMLIVLGVFAIVAAIVVAAINPETQLADARGGVRRVHLREIENSLTNYVISGQSLTNIPVGITNAKTICQQSVSAAECASAGGYSLSDLVPEFLVEVPKDPYESGDTLTGYGVYKVGSFIRICSPILDVNCGAELPS